jgi:hypothetical protein
MFRKKRYDLFTTHLSPQTLTSNQKLFGNELATRLKRVMKAEAKDFNLFCSRRLDPIPTTQSYLRCSQSLQADRIPEYEYDTTYSRPTSSMSSTPTCAYEGPQTPSRSRSPMNMNEIVSSTIGREGSPAPLEMTSLVARNSYRVKRKTLPSPRSPPRSIPGTSHFGTEPQEPGKLRRSRVGSIDATYTPSLDPLAGIYPGHTNALIHDALDEGLKPSPLQVRTYSNAGSLASSVTSHSHSEIVPAYGGDARFDSLAGNNLGPSLLPDSKIADPNGLISPMSPISSSNVGSESAENLRPSALLTGQRVHAPSPVQASKIPNSPTSPISPPSYSETDLQNQTNAAPQVPAAHPSESSAPPITVADAIGVPPSSQTPSNGDDCTLELVHHLPSSERRDSERRDLEAQYPTRESITPNQLPRQPLGVPNTSLKDIESGLELATTFNPPRAPRTHSYGHPERPIEPDAISLRPSIRSSNSKGKSKFGFLKRFGGSKNLSVEEVVPSLPDSLQFCFSVCSQSLVLWSKKDSDFIVQIKHPFKTGRKIDLGNSRESNLDISGQRKGFSIRFVVASSQIVAAYACVNKVNHI